MISISDEALSECQDLLGYHFKDINLLAQALTHPTFAYEAMNESVKDNQRLEFLGDSVLNMIIAEHLYKKHPDFPEGRLTKSRSMLVNNNVLLKKARELNVSKFIILGKGEELTGGRNNGANLSSAFEAIIGAVYLDGGLETVRGFIIEKFIDRD